jgi:hypothetical protein
MSVDLPQLVHSFSSLVGALVTDDVGQRDRSQVEALLGHAARVQSMSEAVRLAATRRLEQLADQNGSLDPRDSIMKQSRSSGRAADRTVRRSRVAQQMPALSDALAAGEVSGDHLDVVAQALGRLEPDERARLADQADWIATIAANSTPDELARALRRRVRQLSADDGVQRFQRQRRATTLRSWKDPDTGMCRLVGEFDPESGARLVRGLADMVQTLLARPLPDTCPDDERKHGHLTAIALLELVTGARGSAAGGHAEFIVVIDHETLWKGLHDRSRIEVDGDFDLPIETLRRLACTANVIPVVLDGDGVARDVGRARRIATRAQRRAMRAMYATCAVPGCRVAFHDCVLHHIRYWRNGGRTDLDNFVPLCSRHHFCVHEGGWSLHLRLSDRVLTITLPDGNTRANPPPFASVA